MPARASSAVRPCLAVAAGGEAERVVRSHRRRTRWRCGRGRAGAAPRVPPPAASSPITRGIASDRWRMHVDEHDRDRRRDRAAAPLASGGGSDITMQPVGSLRLGQRAQVVVALLDRLDVVDDEVELAVGENGVDAAQPFSRLRPGEERNDDPDGQRPTEAQATRGRARREAKLLHHREDAVAGLWVDHVHPVERPRGRRDADARVACDVADGDRLLRHAASDVTGYMRPVSIE